MTEIPLATVLLDAVVSLVPQWYAARSGPNRQTISVGGSSREFFSHRELTRRLRSLVEVAEQRLAFWYRSLSELRPSGAVELVQEDLALEWLNLSSQDVDWRRVLRYVHAASSRTHENAPVTFNMVIGDGVGRRSLAEPDFTKVLDQLGSSSQVFIRVDRSLRFVGYDEIAWNEVDASILRGCNPWSLQPYVSKLRAEEFSVHLTRSGDVVFARMDGVVASRRKRRWHLYDLPTFSNAVIEVLKSVPRSTGASKGDRQFLAAWLIQVAFDLSYRRHGALLVYDPERVVSRNHVHNGDSILGSGDTWYDLVGSSLSDLAGGGAANQFGMRRRFLELASLDGAVLFDDHRIVGFGSMITQSPEAGSHAGARTTAAHSAYKWGGLPVKISADGDITILFRSVSGSEVCDAGLTFL